MERVTWQRIAELFAAALEQPTGGREAFLEQYCGDDIELREAVIELLNADGSAHSLLDGGVEKALDLRDLVSLDNQRIGPYRVQRQIGIGGMGAVYLAEREDGGFSQTVALKLMRAGASSTGLARRFRAERQLLAGLEHPAIARLIDGGVTTDGRPYFTMEYVDGVTIDEFCRRQRLSIARRLELFAQVLEAVAYAQQNLVVHRDLKPSNILVTESGEVKLLDFGIAKVLADDGAGLRAATQTAMVAMTPQYAAPEQVRSEPVTTATDVYALGVILYELLSGSRPYELSTCTPAELDELVCRTVPPLASMAVADDEATTGDFGMPGARVRRRLEGDLDMICAMALRKEPARRYASAQQMLDDLERHRAGWPVRARPDTLGYRLGKFFRRHTRPLLGALAALLVVAAVLLFYTNRLAKERDRAEREARKAEAVSGFLISIFEQGNPAEQGEVLSVRELLDRGAARVDEELSGQPQVKASILLVIGRVYADFGAPKRAEEVLTQALALGRSLYRQHPMLATSLLYLGTVKSEQGQHADAEVLLREALAIRESLLGPTAPENAAILSELGYALYFQDRLDDAESALRRAADIGDPKDVSEALNILGILLHARHQVHESERVYRRALDVMRALYGETHPNYAASMHNLAQVLMDQERLEEAAALQRRALDLTRETFGPGNHTEEPIRLQGLAFIQKRAFDFPSAESNLRQAHDLFRKLFGPDSYQAIQSWYNLGTLFQEMGDYRRAEAQYRQLLDNPGNVRRSAIVRTEARLGDALYELGDYPQALRWIRKALPAEADMWPAGHSRLARTQLGLARALAATGELDQALQLQREALEQTRTRYGGGHWRYLVQLDGMVGIRLARAEHPQAEAAATELLAGRRERYGDDHPHTAAALRRLAQVRFAQADYPAAKEHYRDAIAIWRDSPLAEHPLYGHALIGLGRCHIELGDMRAAEPVLRQGLAILAARLPAEHSHLVAARKTLTRLDVSRD